MKMDIMKYNNYTDYRIVIDGKEFTYDTVCGDYAGHAAITEFILQKKFGATLVYGGGMIMHEQIVIVYKGREHTIKIGDNRHKPDSLRYYINVVKKHLYNLKKAIADIDAGNYPIVTMEF